MSEEKQTELSLWEQNYAGLTPISKFVLAKSKLTYKGDVYIPWSVMLHALYALDPKAVVIKVPNSEGGYVHTDINFIKTVKDGVETMSTIMSHMVKVIVRYMGTDYEDIYPVQDKDYSASKVYDQNMVNKALQRCMTRVASLATGIGWSMYESGEAQFDGVKEDQKEPERTVMQPVVDKPVLPDDPVLAVAKLLFNNKDNAKIATLVTGFNVVLSREYKDTNGNPITLNLATDTEDEIRQKVSVVKDPSKMLKSLNRAIGGS